MTQLISVTRIIALIVTLFGGLSLAHAEAYQPVMQETLDLLEQAKASPEPLPLLEKARTTLQGARNNKGGRKQDALKSIDEAIEIAKSGGDPKSKISHAITMVKSGISRGKS